jgi:hypothetical protein
MKMHDENCALFGRRSLVRFIGCAMVFAAAAAFSQTASENFEDGSLSPFNVEMVTNNISEIIRPTGFSARAGSNVHHIVWYEDNYDGTRASKGVEGASSDPRITSDGWYGFSFYMPSGFPVPGKQMVLGQIICWHSSLPNTSITVTLGVNTNGALVLDGAYGVGDGGKTTTAYATLSPLLTKGAWHDVVVYCKFSQVNTGILRVWVDGAPEDTPTAEFTGINLGNGAWSGDELMTHGGYIKWGPYCWDNANYDAGESREIYYDEIAYQVGNPAGSFDLVKPAGYGTGYVPEGSPVGYWRFDDGANGSEILTAVSEVNSPAMDGAQWDGNAANVLYSGDVAGAYVYDPVTLRYRSNTGSMLAPAGADSDNSQIAVQDMSALNGSFTLEMFVKIEDDGGAADFPSGSYNRLFNLDGSMSCNGTVGATGGGTTLLQFKLGSIITDYTSNLEDGGWHHLAYVVNYNSGIDTTTFQLFSDYVNVASGSFAGSFTNTSANQLRFGVSSSNLSGFDWFVDEVRLSDGVLMNYQFLQSADQAPGAAGYWRFEDGTNGTEIVTAVSEVNSPAMDGGQWISNATNVLYSSDVTGAYIYDPLTFQTNANAGSMLAPGTAGGGNSQIAVQDMSILDGSWTLEMFVKVESAGDAVDWAAGAANRLFNLDGSVSCNGTVGATGGGTTLLKFRLDSTITDYSSNFEDGNWHHLAYVADYDGSNTTITLYRDYTSVGSTSISGQFVTDSGDDLRFGISSAANVANIDWFLDDVRLSDSALKADQFLRVVEGGAPLETPTITFSVSAGGPSMISWPSTIGTVDSFRVMTNADLTNPNGWGDAGLSAYDDGAGNFVVTNAIGDESRLFYRLESK